MAESRRRPSTCPRCGLSAGPGLRYCGGCSLDLDRLEGFIPAPGARASEPLDPLAALAPSVRRFAFARPARPEHLMNGPALGMLVLGVAGAAGALLAWFTVAGTNVGAVSRSGLEMGAFGFLALVGGLALAIAGAARAVHAGSLALAQLVGLVASLALVATFVAEFVAMDSVARRLLGTGSGIAGVGVGLFLVVVAGVAGIILVGLITAADN